jgi:cytochrome c553
MSALPAKIALLALVLLPLPACVGDTPSPLLSAPDAGAELDEQALAKQEFVAQVQPLLTSYCAACHGADTSVPFLAGAADMYASVMEWPNLVSLRVPSASSLLSKGAHSGPAWQQEQGDVVRSWIEQEAALAPADESSLETAPFVPSVGENVIDLSAIGLAGASIQFRMEPLASGMYLSRMSLQAGASGVHIVHPTFVPWEGDTPNPDPVDRFSNIDIYAAAQQVVSVGGGTLILVQVPSNAPLSIRFELAEVANAGDTVLAGCKDVTSFTANARSPLLQYCSECHSGANNSATNATDMTRLADLSEEGQAAACGQILSRVNLLDPNNSSIFLAPEPQSPLGHSFKLPDNNSFLAFRSALTLWISAEQNAP